MNTNKRIGMAINYNYPDYGGMLQAYASYKKIRDLGYEPETINIDALSKDIRNRKIKYFAKNIYDISIVKEKSHIVSKKIRIKIDKTLRNNLDKRYKAFEKFYKEHFKISTEYKNWDELSNACRNYGAVIVGSDQLWLPSNIEGDYYTLSFVPDDVKKIAYATSFGVSKIQTRQEKKVEEYLSRIDYLSAREKSGQDIIKKSIGRDVPLVCDPALLLTANEWDEDVAQNRIIQDKYIFCYFMGNNPWQREFVIKFRELTGYRVISLLHLDQYIKSDEKYIDEALYDISPADFINLVKNAEIVCTDSFHGSVFSIIYGKKFFTFKRFSENATLSTNTRIDTLLQELGLEDRLVIEKLSPFEVLKKKMDMNFVQEKLDKFRKSSLEYLILALEA